MTSVFSSGQWVVDLTVFADSHNIFKYVFGKTCKVPPISKLASLALSVDYVLSSLVLTSSWTCNCLVVFLIYCDVMNFFEMFI